MFNILDSLKKLNISKKMDVPKITILILLSGLLLMIFPGKKEIKNNKNEKSDFIKKIENELSQMISNVENAGKSSVLITLDEGEEIVYATENRKNNQEFADDDSGNLKRKINDSEKSYSSYTTGTYTRDKELAIDGFYDINNIQNFMIGQNGELLLIYNYGNEENNYTITFDVIKIEG